MNLIILKGRLTRDVETKISSNNKEFCKFSIAVNRRFENEQADFFNCTAFGKTAEFIGKYFKKGQEILLSGEMQSQKFTDKEGNNRTSWDVIVNQVDFCGSAKDKQNDIAKSSKVENDDSFTEIDDDDLPF